MPLYLYKNPLTDEVKEVFQGMNDEHVYSEDGVGWQRVWTSPQATIDSRFDPFSEKDFVKKTASAGTLGDLWDRSKEWSEKRADKIGAEDPVRKKYFKEFSKTRKGKKHEADTSPRIKKSK